MITCYDIITYVMGMKMCCNTCIILAVGILLYYGMITHTVGMIICCDMITYAVGMIM